jgi:DNA-binding NtrC family response regulator
MSQRVLLADDQGDVRSYLSGILRSGGYRVVEVAYAEEVISHLSELLPDLLCLVLDMDFGTHRMRGPQALDQIRKIAPGLPVILLSSAGTTEEVVQAIKKGATAFLEKGLFVGEILPIAVGQLDYVMGLRRELERQRSELRLDWRAIALIGGSHLDAVEIVGQAQIMSEFRAALLEATSRNVTVTLRGERGTGRKLAAASLHYRGPLAARPLVHVHCQALAGGQLPAFVTTEPSEGYPVGTIVLACADELPLGEQERLLPLLSSVKEGRRLVLTTAEDLEGAVKAGTLRKDLRDKLGEGVVLRLPPLRERSDDLPQLIAHIAGLLATTHGRKRPVALDAESLEVLRSHSWPGNVTELRLLLEELTISHTGDAVGILDLPLDVAMGAAEGEEGRAERLRRGMMRQILRASGGDTAVAARALGIDEAALQAEAAGSRPAARGSGIGKAPNGS